MKKLTPADFQAENNNAISLNGKYNMETQRFEMENIKWGTNRYTTQSTQYTQSNGWRTSDMNTDSCTD